MQLKTEYREQSAGTLTGSKRHYIFCNVTFSNEERAVIDERGLYDLYVIVPSDTPPPAATHGFFSLLLKGAGILLIPLGLLFSCVQYLRPDKMAGAGPWPFLWFCAGVTLFVTGMWKQSKGRHRLLNPNQPLTIRRLLANPEFIALYETLDLARKGETEIRDAFAALVQRIRGNIVVPEQHVHEL
jgi:hypothetical protein